MNLAGVDLNLLIALDALIAEASVTRAARRVGLSQPAMSRALGRLRDLLEDPVLLRTPRGMVVTSRAQGLARPLRRILGEIAETLEPHRPFDPMTASGTFRLSVPDAGQIMLIPALLRRLEREAPGLSLDVVYEDPEGGQYASLESGGLDLGIEVSHAPAPGFHVEHILDAGYTCIARRDHPGIGRRLTLAKFLELGHVAFRRESGRAEPDVEQLLARHAAARRIVLGVPSYLPIPWLVAGSDLVATLPALVVDVIADRFPIRRHPPPIPIAPVPVSIVWHERTHENPEHRWLRGIVAQLFREAGRAERAPARRSGARRPDPV